MYYKYKKYLLPAFIVIICIIGVIDNKKGEKYLRFGNGKEERMSSKPSARKQNTRKKKEKRTRANKKHTNACK